MTHASPSRSRWLLVGILLLAALLRLQKVTQPLVDNFSWREASTAMMADNFYRTNPNIFFPEVSWTGPGPNYQGREFQTFSWIVAMIWRATGHQTETVGRLVSIAFGLLGVFSMYKLVRRVWDEERALASALVLAISPGAVFIDRSFLPDPAMLGLTLLASWLVVRAAQTGRGLAVAAFACAMAFLTKLPGITVLPMLVYVATRPHPLRPSRRQLGVALAALLVPVVAYYAWAVYLGTHYPPYHVAGSGNWLWKGRNVQRFFGERWYAESVLNNLTYWFWTVPVFGLVIVGLLIPPPETRREGSPDVRWAAHWLVAGSAVLYVLGARELSENVWNFHIFNAFAAMLAGHALVTVTSLGRPGGAWWTRLGIAAVVALTLYMGRMGLWHFYDSSKRLNTMLMGQALARVAAPGDLVATIADDVGDPIGIYYSRHRGWVFPQAHRPEIWKDWNRFPTRAADSILLFDDLRSLGAKWLGITATPRDDSSKSSDFWTDQPEVVAHIEATCERVERTPAYSIYRILTPTELDARTATRPTTRPRP